jgi:hypothetical protein
MSFRKISERTFLNNPQRQMSVTNGDKRMHTCFLAAEKLIPAFTGNIPSENI